MTRFKILLALFCTQLIAAQPAIEGQIGEIAHNGWHEILLSPQIRAASKADLRDFRIHDSKGNEVPYFFSGANLPTNSNPFQEYQILSETAVPGRSTELIIANPLPQLTALSLLISNSAVTKKYRISGSNDQKKWFGVIDNDSLQNITNPVSSFTTKTITLPKTAYRYLKIAFDDTKTLPLNITRVGNYLSAAKAEDLFIEIQDAVVKTHQTKQNTVISIVFDGEYTVDRIQFEISQPKLFKRTARVYFVEDVKRKRRTSKQQHILAEFELSTDVDRHIDLPANKLASLFIEIENGDNQPLEISAIKLLQRPVYAVAEFQKQNSYTISTGLSTRNTPQYDVEYFSEQILTDVYPAKITAVKNVKPKSTDNLQRPFWQHSWFLWTCISIAGLAILYFSISLVRDINGKHTDG